MADSDSASVVSEEATFYIDLEELIPVRDMTVEEATLAQELFKSGEMPPPAKGEGKERLTVRFDPGMPGVVYYLSLIHI